MWRSLSLAIAFAMLFCLAAGSPAEAQRRALGGGLMGAGIGGAVGGGKGAAVGGAIGLGVGLISEDREKSRRRKRDRREQERAHAYQQQQFELQQQQMEIERQRLLMQQQTEMFQQQQQQQTQVQPELAAPNPQLVTDVATELAALGYQPGEVDGVYRAETRRAIESYQYHNRLPITGLPSADLVAHLRATRAEVDNQQLKQRVAEMEHQLAALGYNAGPADGIYTAETRQAIESYQFENGLRADGRPTTGPLDHLDESVSEVPRERPEAFQPGKEQMTVRELVAEIQVHLSALGLNPGTVDGFFGPQTEESILAFQAKHGFMQNGQATFALLQHLRDVRAAEEGLEPS